ncbi:MAG TPA: ABC transporter permease [Candidatus Limnocylindrales bacterium]|jgi:NitT/TauT family transport system permease protein|nr:ABC transporter permease [Candidatus Limnocylindrales bacterium]
MISGSSGQIALVGRPAGRFAARVQGWALPAAIFLGALAAWELVVRVLGLKQFILPSPVAIANATVTYFPELWSSARYTAVEIVGGLLIGVVAGLLVGAITARFAVLRESLLPFGIAANSVPIIAFAPLFNNWFGIDKQLSKAMVAAVLVFFPVMINTVRGLRNVDPAALELMRSYAAGELQVFRRVRVPASLPFVFTALRIATTLATIGAVIGEYFGAPALSLGQYIARNMSYLAVERSWAAIVFASAIGIALYLGVVVLERLVMPWAAARASER